MPVFLRPTNQQGVVGLQILFKSFNLDSYYPLPDSMYNCALSQSSHVDWQRFKEPPGPDVDSLG